MSDESYDREAPAPATRPGPTLFVLVGLLAGAAVGFALAWVLGGNPLSSTNRVEFTQLTVASVSEEGDRLCWAETPERRDSPLQCAILSLDPTAEPPREGDRVTAGLVELEAPDGTALRQVVHVGSPAPSEAEPEATDGTEPDGTEPEGD